MTMNGESLNLGYGKISVGDGVGEVELEVENHGFSGWWLL